MFERVGCVVCRCTCLFTIVVATFVSWSQRSDRDSSKVKIHDDIAAILDYSCRRYRFSCLPP
ncbi:hypothetical protein JMJ77_0008723 [Colletotrichum scovillei]|uniref:Uncharacterized protein n=1 Tax=Colletotrichum scovillei TaxID=1209932 RepID=A0A9P7QT75_9PEZI|nr:hypothetical protein JMJ78_0001581 [Colletotrichum scovillei]KAG7041017.1 hypothetical protein JMJ77_0008723 [Colletotrichum scovillei]KAG7061050.1 hypothetical protein JMJ76_0010121 [Colletotrichum scovillei]